MPEDKLKEHLKKEGIDPTDWTKEKALKVAKVAEKLPKPEEIANMSDEGLKEHSEKNGVEPADVMDIIKDPHVAAAAEQASKDETENTSGEEKGLAARARRKALELAELGKKLPTPEAIEQMSE